MLNLSSATDSAWLDRARAHLEAVLLDHAHCEKKAAGAAVKLLFAYPQHGFMQAPLSALAREELWNGNHESLRNLVSRDPDRNIVLWAWTQHSKYVERYSSAMTDPEFAHLDFVRLRSRRAMRDWLES